MLIKIKCIVFLRNLSKIVSVLLSAMVERVGVSRMQDFFLEIYVNLN